jgi:Protein of unknown function (DUF3987)
VENLSLNVYSGDGGGCNGSGPHSDPLGSSPCTPREPPWEPPIPIDARSELPQFPTELLPDWLAGWVDAVAGATQTPPDLAALLALPILGAGAARKSRVLVRPGWAEPLNLFAVTALPPGDRKSAVFSLAIEPVQDLEREELERAKLLIAQAASEERILEAALKKAEDAVVKESNPVERDVKLAEAAERARKLAGFRVPDEPRLLCDDITAESLAKMLARRGGRMLVASDEGTVFEVCKGRYSERPNFEVYLKGHSGDALRCDRVGRDSDIIDAPALSLAHAVQPDVLHMLGGETSMKGRGFLARFLYAVPRSPVGSRQIAPPPVHQRIARRYAEAVSAVWRLQGREDDYGKPAPYWLLLEGGRPRHGGVRGVAGAPTGRGRAAILLGRLGRQAGRGRRPHRRRPAPGGYGRGPPALANSTRGGDRGEGGADRPRIPPAPRPGRFRHDGAGVLGGGGGRAGGAPLAGAPTADERVLAPRCPPVAPEQPPVRLRGRSKPKRAGRRAKH